MPYLQRPCGARIFYETKGSVGNIPILLLAPGGMRSSISKWTNSPYNPWKELYNDSEDETSKEQNKYYLIGMDQRFANNRSTGTVQIDTGWHTFLEDQLALLDHLQITKCHLFGSCIGPSYAFQLLKHSPDRFDRCVMLQPIGLTKHTTEPGEVWEGLNTDAAWRWVGDWADEMIETKKCNDLTLLRQLHDNMFGYPSRDFVFSITRQDTARIQNPLLVFMGKDIFHPAETAREICRIAPNAELVEVWRDAGQEKLKEAFAKIEAFLEAGDSNFHS